MDKLKGRIKLLTVILLLGVALSPPGALAATTIGANISTDGTFTLTSGAGVGYILTSNGAGLASWSDLNLGIADSPTFTGLTLSGLTPGSVTFAGVGGAISEDNANFFWDNTNKRLGIGTTTPGQKLEVNGIGKINTGLQVGADITSPVPIDRTISNVSYMTVVPNHIPADYWHIGQYNVNQYFEGSDDSTTRAIGSINQVIVPITYTGNILAGDIWGSPALMGAENSVFLDGGTSVPLVVGTFSNVSMGAFSWPVLGTNITEARSFMGIIPSSPMGSIINAVGLYIADSGGTAGIANQYGVYVQGDKNYFAGNVGIGTTTPSSPLSVVAPNTWADYGVIAAQNMNRSASATINALDSLNVYQTYLGVGSPLANDYGPRMGSTGFLNTQPIPFGITNGGLGLYQAANSGGIGFFNNRPRGIFDIGNFSVSTGVISLSDFPADGDTVTITDALATTVTYTFTTNNVGTNVNIEADIPNTLFNLQNKINVDLDMDAYVDGDGTYIMLGQKTAGVAGDVPITKTGANISVIGMSGGSNFVGMADLYIDGTTGKLITAHDISGKNFEVDGGIRYNTATAKPACNATTRGTTWFTQGGDGVKDDFEVCAKDATDVYAWRAIY